MEFNPSSLELKRVEAFIPYRQPFVDEPIKPIKYYRFRDYEKTHFYGGWLVYELAGKRYRFWVGDKAAERILARGLIRNPSPITTRVNPTQEEISQFEPFVSNYADAVIKASYFMGEFCAPFKYDISRWQVYSKPYGILTATRFKALSGGPEGDAFFLRAKKVTGETVAQKIIYKYEDKESIKKKIKDVVTVLLINLKLAGEYV